MAREDYTILLFVLGICGLVVLFCLIATGAL